MRFERILLGVFLICLFIPLVNTSSPGPDDISVDKLGALPIVTLSDYNATIYAGADFNVTATVSDLGALTITDWMLIDTPDLTTTPTESTSSNSNNITFHTAFADLHGELNYSINITIVAVYSSGNVSGSTFVLTVQKSNTTPVILPFNSSNCAEDSVCTKYFTANDSDVSENLTMTIPSCLFKSPLSAEWTSCSFSSYLSYYQDTIYNTTWQMNLTPTNTQVGEYNISFNFTDITGLSDSDNLIFNITNVNNAPELKNNSALTQDIISFGNIVENISYSKTIYAKDLDLLYGLDNLTFNYSWVNGTLPTNIFNFTDMTATDQYDLVVITILANSSYTGNYTFNLTVTDNSSIVDYQLVNFSIYNQSLPPNITHVKPSYNETNLITDFISTSNTTTNTTEEIVVSENTTITFGVNVTSTETLTYSWFYDDVTIAGTTNTTTYSFDFFSAGEHTMKISIQDPYYSTVNFTWNILVTDLNRVPRFVNNLNISDSSIVDSVTISNFFKLLNLSSDIVFYDPDDDLNNDGKNNSSETNNLTFALSNSSNCATIGNFTFDSRDTITITAISTAACNASFVARDSNDTTATTNNITLYLTKTEATGGTGGGSGGGTTTITQRITIPYNEEIPEPTEFKLVNPGIAAIYENNTVHIPIVLSNIWNEGVRGIELSANATMEDMPVEGLNFTFSEDYVDYLAVGSSVNLTLTIENYRTDAPLQVNISAYIDSLDYTDSAIIYVNALEASGEYDSGSLQTRVGFARDLLNDNSECQELMEILNQAEKRIGTENVDALKEINAVIEGCKYLISNKEQINNVPHSFLGKAGIYANKFVDMKIMGTILGAFIIIGITIGMISKFKLKPI